ncbi:hypothetical protein FRC03_011996 [Tulasnella sp. 419]|nr:hypothetical protein FRC03_011996 [Tulasnella sp. 419]
MINRVLVTIVLSILTCNQLVIGHPLGQDAQLEAPTANPASYNTLIPRHVGLSVEYWILGCIVQTATKEHREQEKKLVNLYKKRINSGLREIKGPYDTKITRAKKDVELAKTVEQAVTEKFTEFKTNNADIAQTNEAMSLTARTSCSNFDASGRVTELVRQTAFNFRELKQHRKTIDEVDREFAENLGSLYYDLAEVSLH